MNERFGFNSLHRQSFVIWLWCAIHPSKVLAERDLKYRKSTVCLYTHTQYKDPPCLFAKSSRFWRALYRALFEYYGFLCTLERITLSALKTRQDPKESNYLYAKFLKFMDLIKMLANVDSRNSSI